jgi:hypothetical protein
VCAVVTPLSTTHRVTLRFSKEVERNKAHRELALRYHSRRRQFAHVLKNFTGRAARSHVIQLTRGQKTFFAVLLSAEQKAFCNGGG